MNLIDKVRHIPHGVSVIGKWLGSGGEVVSLEVAQQRAWVCQGWNPTGRRCKRNVDSFKPTEVVAEAIKSYLSVKNELGLKVKNEDLLGTCDACGCVLKLLVWEPKERVDAAITADEQDKLPSWCWKLRNED